MNHVDKSESFDPEALRRKASEIRTIASGATPPDHDGGKTVELNPLAQKIALQFRADTYSPAMIIGDLADLRAATAVASSSRSGRMRRCRHTFSSKKLSGQS